MEDINKKVKLLEKTGKKTKKISEKIKKKKKKKKGGFLGKLLRTLSTRMLGSALTGRGVIRSGEGRTRASEKCQCHPIL